EIFRPADDLSFCSELANLALLSTQGETLVKAGRNLPLELRHGPPSPSGLDFVEAAFIGVFEGEEQDVVSPAKKKGVGRFGSRLLPNLKRGQLPSKLLETLLREKFGSRLLPNLRSPLLVGEEERAKASEIPGREPLPEFLRQPSRKGLQ